MYVKKYTAIRGKRVLEDRLRSTYLSFGFVLPVSVLIYGWTIDKGKGGMAVPIIALFFNGVAQTFCFPSINAYCIDCLPHLGGDAIASNYFARYIAGAVCDLFDSNSKDRSWMDKYHIGFCFSGRVWVVPNFNQV